TRLDLTDHLFPHLRRVRLVLHQSVPVEIPGDRPSVGIEVDLRIGADDGDPVPRIGVPLDVLPDTHALEEGIDPVRAAARLERRHLEKKSPLPVDRDAETGAKDRGDDQDDAGAAATSVEEPRGGGDGNPGEKRNGGEDEYEVVRSEIEPRACREK